MSADLVRVRSGVYHDSVSLMGVSRALAALPGVEAAVVAMATELNLGLARDLGFDLPPADPSGLLIAVRAGDAGTLDAAEAELERQFAALANRRTGGEAAVSPPRTTRAALAGVEGAAVALVSVPGEHAFAEALDAVEAGVSVMVFSDNVSIEQEIRLKDRAAAVGALVMGPDCGTAAVGGVGLGFANVLRPGEVGLVAASGTGAQQVATLLDHAGAGVSHILGVGGRDLSAEVRGRSTVRALRALDADPATSLIVLISKPPAPEAADLVLDTVRGLATPVVPALLGPDGHDLTSAAEAVLNALEMPIPDWPSWIARESGEMTAHGPGWAGGALHGLYAGGTLCAEAEALAGEGTFTDFGADAYTRGRPHPMIDGTLRLDALAAVPAGDVVLLDVVLGHGADPDPSASLAPAVAQAVRRGIAVVAVVVGTEGDPQGLTRQIHALAGAGASVFISNAHAVRHAVSLTGSAK
ncbi:FdrA family protein [Sinosporangium siamense]|uniref:ATP-citrate synthase/succinyl-CoA ligase C-terminal domain-containing protein n=1 Tax=Sinosporangium siamense TaxID=1367973 RepID=A0A919RHU3_9ACTN|nr:FdrA family protein [Sinosporangium siamense]GII92094.1 hypothetical protein Ssi02_23250 [Sinosporangium siamense]